MKAIIVDDVKKVAESLALLVSEYCDGVEIVGIANSANSAVELIEKAKPDIVFLDIQMPGKTGFDLLSSLDTIDFSVIFVTAYNEYAIKAIRFGAIDYLLKPVDLGELKEAIERAKNKSELKKIEVKNIIKNLKNPGDDTNTIIINSDKGYDIVKIEDILRIEADDNYSIIFTEQRKRFVSSKNLKSFEQFLDKNNFLRIHHSHLVNLSKVVKINLKNYSEIQLSNGEKLSVSVRKKQDLIKRFGKF